MTRFLQVVTTVDSQAVAESIAGELLDAHLAGCVQILGPITSMYRWKGERETAEEWMCVIKTDSDSYGDLEKAIRRVHPYDVPEILAMDVATGHADYLTWLKEQLRPGE